MVQCDVLWCVVRGYGVEGVGWGRRCEVGWEV